MIFIFRATILYFRNRNKNTNDFYTLINITIIKISLSRKIKLQKIQEKFFVSVEFPLKNI